ncbi:T9SS sorting signal type C domain-containing protein [Flavobacterium suncheonense]|uniref:T9SS sorting signal type C domain-containing protein n=1 Tax=Flavobacterium suncheonense TaxID=350894 RepID=UPI000401246A|nr:T9SS sorting signal type C domain-containing protein [Flavobacterium suncheonense]
MHIFRNSTFRRLSVIVVFLLANYGNGQVVFNNDLDQITSDVCTGTSKKIAVSTVSGTCTPYAGNVNSVVFTWQVESSPGVWQNITAFSISGITYDTEQRINAGGTVISSILTINVAYGTDEATWNYRVLAQGSGGCALATSLNEAIAVKKNRWLGTVSSAWSDPNNWSCSRVPAAISSAIILPAANNPVITVNAAVKDLTLQPGSVLTVNSGYNLTASGPVTVVGDGNFTLQNNANLLQTTYTGNNSGPIRVGRNSSALMRQDYTLWSSPVTGQNLLNFSPQTLTGRFYEYNTLTNTYSAVNPSANTFQTGKGYLIRMPNNHPTTPTVWSGQFTGVPNNGDITLSLVNGGAGFRYNAIGNPYPSPVKMSNFVNANSTKITGTLYFWRKTNNTATEPGYCTWTLAGFVSNGEAQVVNPNGILRTGQGFIVEMVNSETSVLFNNAMRVANNADQFFKITSDDSDELAGDKFCLNIVSDAGVKNQMLLGYFDVATNGVDFAIDGKAIEETSVALSTLIGGEKYLIEGRAPFQNEDVVPLYFNTDAAGQFTISLERLEGLFLGSQEIYLKDNVANVVHNLKAGAYVFTSGAGAFSNRFEIRYTDSSLGVQHPDLGAANVIAYVADNSLVVKSNAEAIEAVQVFDVQGRLLTEKKNIDTTSAIVPLTGNKQVLLVKIAIRNGLVATRKIIF